MAVAIRKHLKDFIAVAVLAVIALAFSFYIVQQQRLRIPILEEKPFELKADFQTAQGVVAGQGQTINVAGVRVGDVQSVDLENGVAVVTFAIDRKYLPIYKDATILLRPRTGLQDMFFQLDPGTKSAGEFEEGDTVPLSNTAPDVNLDEILSALDGDTQAYLRLLLVGAGEGLKDRGKDLGDVLGSLGPLNRDLDRLNSAVAERDQELSNLVHNLNILTNDLGNHGSDILRLVESSNTALGAIAKQQPDVEAAVKSLNPTLSTTDRTLTDVSALSKELGPTFSSLSNALNDNQTCNDIPAEQRKFACSLDAVNASLEDLGNEATPAVRDQIRPLVRSARPVVPPLRTAATRYTEAAPKLEVLGKEINRLGNMAAYNPNGAENCPGGVCGPGRDEGYLYWAAWLGHLSDNVFSSQDAHGVYRRIYFTLSCANAANLVAETPLSPIISSLPALFRSGGPCNP
jgi:phospholipid/cholesterol/gamma-HCH transport system substrate-binding protein